MRSVGQTDQNGRSAVRRIGPPQGCACSAGWRAISARAAWCRSSAAWRRATTGYLQQAEAAGMPAEERAHSRTLRAMAGGLTEQQAIAGTERWHLTASGGGLRAAIFGVNDGLLSNFSW